MLNFLTESSSKDFQETATIGSFSYGNTKNSFDTMYENAYNKLMDSSANINPMVDINFMIKNRPIMEAFKDSLLDQLKDDCAEIDAKAGEPTRYSSLYEQTSTLFDNCLEDLITESTRVGQLLPIKAVDFPVLIKQNLAIASKDIIQTEVTKSPIIKKHIERRWIVDEKTGKRWEYPQCFFKDDFKEIYNAGMGLPIHNDEVPFGTGLFNYSIAENLSDSEDPSREKITYDLKIIKAKGNATVPDYDTDPTGQTTKSVAYEVPMNMRINLSDGTWLGGQIKDPDTDQILDVITGTVDLINNTVSLSCANGSVESIVFGGYLSNEYNERTVTFDRTREEYEWKIVDGFRADVPYSLEQLEDAKALLDIDLYKLTYNDLADILVQMEDSKILEFLDNEYNKYKGIELDPLGFNPFIREQKFDCDYKSQTTALPSEYIQEMLKFYVDRFIIDIADTAKIENMTFVCYGNPRYISLLDPSVKWIVKSGSTVGGVKLNHSYGIMNSGGVTIQVVSTMKYDASKDRKLRFIPYPTDNSQYTFKHYKFTTHILTAQNSAYRPATRPGGSMTYLMGTTRNTTTSIQGIQGSMYFLNTPFILKK